MARYSAGIPTDYLSRRRDAVRWLRHGWLRSAGRRALVVGPLRRIAGALPWHRLVTFPPVLSIELTNACNLRCVMCQRFHATTRSVGSMDFEVFRRIVDELVGSPSAEVLLTGFGEPMVHKEFDRFLHHAVERGLTQLFIISNATLLDAEKTDSILSAGIRSIHFSIDGNSAPTYESIRLGARFDETLANITHFLAERERRGLTRPSVVLRSIEMPQTLPELDGFRRRWQGLLRPSDEIQVQPLSPAGDAKPTPEAEGNGTVRGPSMPCTTLWKKLGVNWNGELSFCCAPGLRSDLHLGLRFPEVSIAGAWSHQKVNQIRRLHITGRKHLASACEGCARG